MGNENSWQPGSTVNSNERQAAAYLEELKATYPTPESIVDDFRHEKISQLALPRRFPEAADQAFIRQMAEERNAADKASHEQERTEFYERYVKPILAVAYDLNEETIAMIVGDEAWDIHEFDAKLEVELGRRTDGESLVKMLEVLTQIRDLAEEKDPSKEDKIKQLATEFNSL